MQQPLGSESHSPGRGGGNRLLEGRDPWGQDTQILAWPASPSPMAWVLGATGLGPNPSPSSFFGRRLRVRTPPAVSLLGACSLQARRLGGQRGEGAMDWSPRWIMPVGMPGILG